ncbi:MAG TPA: glycosyltransferase family 87 protein [Sphingomicrobium sp.]
MAAHESLALLLFLWVVGMGFALQKHGVPPIWDSDYLNYWFAPRAIRAGVNPYDVAAYKQYGLSFFPKANPPQFNFTYPPHSLFLFWPLSYFSAYVSYAAWDVLSLAAFWLAAKRVLPKGLPAVVAVLNPATFLCIQFGQTSLLAGALFLMAAGGSGVAAGLLTFKPQLGFLAAPLLLLKGRKPVLIAVAAAVFLIASSQLLFGGWIDFLKHLGGYQAGQIFDEEKKNIWYIIGTTPAMGYGRLGLVVYLAVSAIVLSRNFNVWTAATATFLMSPYGFHYDMSVACLGFAILIHAYWNDMPLWQRLVASLAYLAPIIVQFGTWWVPPIMLLGLFVQTQCFPGVQLAMKRGRLAIVEVAPRPRSWN